MRHLRSVLYAAVLAPAVWALCGAALTREPGAFALLPLLLAGTAYTILIFAPISPTGPALSGMVFLGAGAWALIAPSSYAAVWPGGGFDLSRPGYALATLLAVPLIGTVLSARRWAGYEPPQIPFIGTLGRARGRAAAPGTPMAADRTEFLGSSAAAPHPADAFRAADRQADAFQAADRQAGAFRAADRHPAANGDEPTMFFPAQPPPAAEPPTEPVTPVRPEPSTLPRPFITWRAAEPVTEEPTATVVHTDEPTTTVIGAGGTTTVIGAGDTTTVIGAGETTTVIGAEEPARVFVTHADGVAEERPIDEVTASQQPTETIAAEERTGAPTGVAPAAIPRPRGREVGAGPTRDFRGGGKTYLDGPGEQTQVIYLLEPANAKHAAEQAAKARAAEQAALDQAAQEKARQAFRDRAAQERARKAFDERAAAEARSVGEETRIIRLPTGDESERP